MEIFYFCILFYIAVAVLAVVSFYMYWPLFTTSQEIAMAAFKIKMQAISRDYTDKEANLVVFLTWVSVSLIWPVLLVMYFWEMYHARS